MRLKSIKKTVPSAVLALIATIFISDLLTPLGLAAWLFYLIPLFLSSWGTSRLNPLVVTMICTFLTVLGFFLSPPGISYAYGVVNRLMGIAVFWIVFLLLTRSKQAEELRTLTGQLETVNKELESFSYTVSHDLQAPLRAIRGYSRMLLKDKEHATDPEATRKLSVIQENTEKMQRLIESLLSLSRIGRKGVQLKMIDMNALAKDVWKEIRMAYPGTPMELKMKELHPAYGDQTLIRQVLANLLSNAVKYSGAKKPIEVEVGSYREKDGNVYYVKDKGIGFDMQYYDKLFGVFQRLHNASEFEGTGIGLSTAQRIIHLHGGRIWAEGKIDEGAVFFFTLPRRK